MTPKFYVVNLKRASERRKVMVEHLAQFGVEFEFFEATDGRALKPEEQELVGLSDKVILTMAGGRKCMVEDRMSPPELGCALSHLRLYQHILEHGDERAVIIEDDVTINADTIKALEHLDAIKAPWDVVSFSCDFGIKSLPWTRKYYFDKEQNQYFSRLGMHNATLDAIFNRRRVCFGTVLYVVTPRACRVLLDKGLPARINADYLLGIIAYHNLRYFLAHPIGHYWSPNEEGNKSTIGERPRHRLVRL